PCTLRCRSSSSCPKTSPTPPTIASSSGSRCRCRPSPTKSPPSNRPAQSVRTPVRLRHRCAHVRRLCDRYKLLIQKGLSIAVPFGTCAALSEGGGQTHEPIAHTRRNDRSARNTPDRHS